MKPLIHAKNSAKKYGGNQEDYIKIHNWFDQTKAALPDGRHRALLHNAFGIFLCEQVFGVYITNSDGKQISVRDIGEDHVIEDLGFIPTLEKCFAHLPKENWLFGSVRKQTKKVIPLVSPKEEEHDNRRVD
jgi:hypothetical protein